MFPVEIYERILYFADGRTLLQANLVCKQWKRIVEYLHQKHNIWKKCCIYDIPKYILYSIKEKCYYSDVKNKWKLIYESYYSLQNLKNNKYYLAPKSSIDYFENNITCCKISGCRIIYGNTAGIICAINEAYEVEDVIVTGFYQYLKNMVFINELESSENMSYNHTHLIAIYETAFLILKLEPKIEQVAMYQYYMHVSVFKDLIAYITNDGVIRIAKIDTSEFGNNILQQIHYYQLNSRTVIRCLCIFDNLLTFITDKESFKIEYEKDNIIRPAQLISLPYGLVEKYWLFYNKIIFCSCKLLASSYLYFSTLNYGRDPVIRKFNSMETLESPVSEILLYGNILILGLLSGKVYIYVVNDWSNFNLENYKQEICVYGQPICNIDVQEHQNEHRLFLTMDNYIAQVAIYHH